MLKKTSFIFSLSLLFCIAASAGDHLRKTGTPFLLKNLTVSVSDTELKPCADLLAGILGRIQGKKAPIQPQDGAIRFTKNKFENAQTYEIRTDKSGISLRCGSADAGYYAAAHLLRELGYRCFFPTARWEILPEKLPESISLDLRESPDYLGRSIWPGWGIWPDYRKSTNNDAVWKQLNRQGGETVSTGHAYGAFVLRNKKAFAEHPEYYALYKGKRSSNKLCLSNPGLRKLFCDYALKQFRAHPEMKSFSADPSDGGGWCECPECQKLGSPSDRAVFMANTLAEAVNREFPGRKIGMYAYNYHSIPPTIEVHPQVVVHVATAFIKGGLSLQYIAENWQKKKAAIGVREYYYAGPQPASGNGTSLKYLQQSLKKFHGWGARHITAEASDAWGPGGLGYYLAANLMWNVNADLKALRQDFLTRAFPGAEKEMDGFYNLLDATNPRPLTQDLLGRMYRALDAAWAKTASQNARARLEDLICYTRFCELLLQHNDRPDWKSYVNLMKFSASIRDRRMVHTYAFFRDRRGMCPKKDMKKPFPFDWKNTPAPAPQTIQAFLKKGIAANQLLSFEPVSFSEKLILLPQNVKQKRPVYGHGRWIQEFYVLSNGSPFTMQVTGGMIKHYRDRGNVQIQLIQIGGLSDAGQLETLIQEDSSVPPDGKPRKVTLTPRQAGLHRVTVNDNGDMTLVRWPVSLPVAVPVRSDKGIGLRGSYYFYVPRNTKTVGFYTSSFRGDVRGPDGTILWKRKQPKTKGHFTVQVPQGQDGKVWSITNLNGVFRLLTVPSCLSLHSDMVLVPAESIPDPNAPVTLKGKTADNRQIEFQTVRFSRQLVPLSTGLPHQKPRYGEGRWVQKFLIWSETSPIAVKVTGGMIKGYRDRGNVEIKVTQIGGKTTNGAPLEVVQEDKSVPPDGNTHQLILKTKQPGLHLVTFNDNGDMTSVKWPENLTVVIPQNKQSGWGLKGDFYFYVPRNTKVIGFYTSSNRGFITSPDGKRCWRKTNAKEKGYFAVEVPAGQDGKLWKISSLNGIFQLLTVPHYLSLHSDSTLIPQELKEK